ncbi:hypothetical protein ACOMHN_032913 [Nucella lapillus]
MLRQQFSESLCQCPRQLQEQFCLPIAVTRHHEFGTSVEDEASEPLTLYGPTMEHLKTWKCEHLGQD